MTGLSVCTIPDSYRLQVVPHFSSGIVERAKRERACKSPHARKARRGGEREKWRVSPFLAWGDFHARSRFARSTTPEDKWRTTRSLGFIAYSKISTLESGLRKLWFRMLDSPDKCARKLNPQRNSCGLKKIRIRLEGAFKLATAMAMATRTSKE